MSSPEAHAEISPSSLNYRAQCRQWERSESSDPKYAEEGRLLHSALETDDPTALDGEQVRVYDMVQSFLDPLQKDALCVMREQRLDIRLGKHTTFGTCDRIILRPGRLAHLIDFKFGRLPVPDANQNLQAMAYAVGVFDLLPAVARIQAWLLSPRRDEASSVVLERHDLPAYRVKLATLFDQLTVSAPATPGPACDYCGKLATCPAVAKVALRIASAYDPALATMAPAEFHASRLTTQQLGEFALPVARTMEKWASAVKAEALDRALAGEMLPGHVVAERSKTQTINDLPATTIALGGLVSDTDLARCASLSLSDLKAVVRANAPKGGKEEAERELLRRLSAAGLCSEQPESIRYIKRK